MEEPDSNPFGAGVNRNISVVTDSTVKSNLTAGFSQSENPIVVGEVGVAKQHVSAQNRINELSSSEPSASGDHSSQMRLCDSSEVPSILSSEHKAAAHTSENNHNDTTMKTDATLIVEQNDAADGFDFENSRTETNQQYMEFGMRKDRQGTTKAMYKRQ